ncbi:DUF167 domain-containing protein [Humitalea sp. 24SJ18S-53]|uniref:DUF167 domain-containing protein n=1 Tax=Humitalea sp. 24SJ18S-53 TaxID=3422307 RepID=UPI003D670C80
MILPAGTKSAWRAVPDGVELRIKAEPKSRRPRVGGLAPGIDGPRLRVAVTEAAVDGRATEAVAAAIATALHLPGRAVTLRAGATSRAKTLHVAGEASVILARLEALPEPSKP